MKTIFYKADSRGYANHGWLKSYHTFSFANYHNPERMSFGMLRVLNDDSVDGGNGFGRHPHRDMEIISIPLEGELRHSDNMGNSGIIQKGDIQVMSAGTGIMHSEENANESQATKFLQIWVIPNKRDVTPRYDQVNFRELLKDNELLNLVSPQDQGGIVWIHQDAWFNWGKYTTEKEVNYKINKTGNGAFVFVLNGKVEIDGQVLDSRDAIGVTETTDFNIKIHPDTEFLIMDVPMDFSA